MMNLQINTKQTNTRGRTLCRLLALLMLCITYANANAAMWLVGDDFNGWNTNGNVKMTESNDGIYTYTADLTAGNSFAFFKGSQAWSSQRGPASGNNSVPTGDWEATTSGGAWNVATTGTYVIEYDSNNDKAKITLVTEYYLFGDQMGWNYDDNNKFTKNAAGDTYTLTKKFSGNFKIRTNAGAWYSNGAQITAENNTVNLNSNDNNNMTIAAQDEPYTLTITKGEQYDVLTITGFASTPTPDTYTYRVVGTPTDLWGGTEAWVTNIEGNNMSSTDDEHYSLTKNPVHLTTGVTYGYKVVKINDNTNVVTWIPDGTGNERTFTVSQNGNYNLTINYTVGDTEASHSLTLVQADAQSFIVAGSAAVFGTEWDVNNADNLMTTSGNGTVYTLTKSNVVLALGTTYEYKLSSNGNYFEGANKTFTVDVPGTYNITFTYNISTGEIAHRLQLVQAGAQNHFKVYVRSSDDARVFLYAWNGSTTFNGTTFDEAMAANLPTVHNDVDNHDWYYLEFDTYFSSYDLIAKTASGTQTDDITNITDPVIYIVYRPDGTYFFSTQGPSSIDALYLMGIVGNQKWSASAGIKLNNNNDGTFSIDNVSLVEGATFSFASRKGSTTDDWEHLLPNLFYPSCSPDDYWVQEKDMNQAIKFGGRGKSAYTVSNFLMEISDSYNIVVNMNDMTVTFTPSFPTVYILGALSYLDDNYNNHTQEWGANIGSRMRTTDGKIYKRNVTLANGSYFCFSTKLGENKDDWSGIADYRFGPVAVGNNYNVTDELINNLTPMPLSELGTDEKSFLMETTASSGHYIMTVDMQNHTLTLKRTYVPSGEVIVHLEKTNNVTNPILKASFLGTDYNAVDEQGNTRVHENDEYETVDGRKWWSWTIENSISDIYIYDNVVSDGSLIINSGKRSGEIFFTYESGTPDEVTRNYEDLGAEGVADCATMFEGHHYVYFTNTPGWQNVYTYMWSMDGENAVYKKPYPGARCSLVGYDDEGYEIWMFDLTAAGYDNPTPEFIIFNDGSNAADKQQSGDFVYHEGACYDYLSTIYLGNSLANIIAQGVVTKGPQYTVEDELVGVKVIREDTPIYDPTDGHLLRTAQYALYAKDMNNYLAPSLIEKEGQIDYMFQRSPLMQGKGRSRYDQSNWVKIVISPTMVKEGSEIEVGNAEKSVLDQYVGKVIKGGTLHANIVNNVNPEMHMLEIDTEGKTSNYPENLNVYIPASFVGTQPCDDESHNPANEYFFVAPKPQEYCEISWAVYNGNTNPPIFCMPTKSFLNGHWNNEGNLSGAFLYDLTLNALNDGAENPNLVTGEAYSFKAIIRKAEAGSAQNAPRRVEQMEPKGDAALAQSTGYMVMPLNLTGSTDQIVTGIDRVDNVSQVVETRYIDLQGRVSNMPHSGVNVVVTRYSDGSTTTRKVMF